MNENNSRYCVSIIDSCTDSKLADLYRLDLKGIELLFQSSVDDFNGIDSRDYDSFADYIDALNRSFSKIIALSNILKEVNNVQDSVPTDSADC